MCDYLKTTGQYRDYLFFVMGINFGLRAGDLLRLRFSDILNEDCTFKESFKILESKTSTTRSRKENRHVFLNDVVMDAVELYLANTEGVSLSDYIFRPDPKCHKCQDGRPVSRDSMNRRLKEIGKECGITTRLSTHSLRKTFGYHQMMMGNNDPRKLLLLQKMFGHSTSQQTLTYIGLTEEEIVAAYRGLNLGGDDYTQYAPRRSEIALRG